MENLDLPLIWAGIIGFSVFAYVVMDGFDLGIGILFPNFQVGAERDQVMNSIAPVWDGNETWLVLGGGGLLAAFPLAYAIILPANYPLIIAMLLGLVFRGIAFEFRWRNPRHRKLWDLAFTLGSFIAAMSQGMILGAILQGVEVSNGAYAGGRLDWLSPFTLLTGISVVLGYGLLGATWLIWKTDGTTQFVARNLAFRLGIATIVAIAAVSAATPFLHFDYWLRWFGLPQVILTLTIPLLVMVCAAIFFRGLARQWERIPFLMTLALFFLGFVGLGVSVYPYIIPKTVTIWEAAAPNSSLSFLLAGTAFIIPLIITYTCWAYWVFRGKVSREGFH